jgi:signal transduction histidine kinase
MTVWRTIRFRVTLVAAVASALLLTTVSVVAVWLVRAQLTDNLDEGLRQRADTVAALIRTTTADLPTDEDLLVQVVDVDGEVIAASTNLAGAGPIVPVRGGYRTVEVPGRPEQFRVLARPVQTPAGAVTLLLGINNDDVRDPMRVLIRVLAGAVPLTVAALAAITWWLTGRTLRPVERIRREMAAISGSNPGRRVEEPGTQDEIDRLAHTMNQTLQHLDDALAQQKRFVADASHELRSPLTRIRTELEVDLATPGSADATERSVLEDVVSLQHLVDDLLQLARSDDGVAPLRLERVDLDDIVLKEARRAIERGRVDVDVRGVTAAQTIGDPRHLARVVRNLLDNAERHARRTVTMTLDEGVTATRLVVVDDGAGVPASDRERVFERFARADGARSRDAGGTGLGLAIARDIVERHGGTITLADGVPTTFVVELAPAP